MNKRGEPEDDPRLLMKSIPAKPSSTAPALQQVSKVSGITVSVYKGVLEIRGGGVEIGALICYLYFKAEAKKNCEEADRLHFGPIKSTITTTGVDKSRIVFIPNTRCTLG